MITAIYSGKSAIKANAMADPNNGFHIESRSLDVYVYKRPYAARSKMTGDAKRPNLRYYFDKKQSAYIPPNEKEKRQKKKERKKNHFSIYWHLQ
jgi:hypothetical protein